MQKDRPVEQVVILSSPTVELVGETVDSFEVITRKGVNATKMTGVGNSAKQTLDHCNVSKRQFQRKK